MLLALIIKHSTYSLKHVLRLLLVFKVRLHISIKLNIFAIVIANFTIIPNFILFVLQGFFRLKVLFVFVISKGTFLVLKDFVYVVGSGIEDV